MVTTQSSNKHAHPGLVDVDMQSSQQCTRSQGKPQSAKKGAAINEIEELEKRLLTEKEERIANAREQPSPSVTKWPSARPNVQVDGTYIF